MLTYEGISNKLLTQIKKSGLRPYNIKNNIEINTLEKEFKCNCAAQDKNPPLISRAEITFGWDSILTSTSVYGNNCSLYHDESIECIHDELEADTFIELYIKYNIAVEKQFENQSDTIYNELMKLFRKNMNHDNLPIVRWNVLVNTSGQTIISSIVAEHFWEINLNENDDLDDLFYNIFEEVNYNLQDIVELPFIKKNY